MKIIANETGIGTSSDTSMITMAKRLTAIEMKELNERQKADHAQRMYDEQRNILRQIENRNLELENNFSHANKLFLSLQKTEQNLREELSMCVPKSINDSNKTRIEQLEKQEHLLRLEVSRLRELTEISLYQTSSLEFINNIAKVQLESFGLIDTPYNVPGNLTAKDVGKLHRHLILMQISEATALRKLQQSQSRCKNLESQLIRAEQKYDRENLDFFNNRKEYISKISYLRSTVQVGFILFFFVLLVIEYLNVLYLLGLETQIHWVFTIETARKVHRDQRETS
jgi:centrosomal protein CEP290